MQQSRIEKLAPLTGVVSSVLFVAGGLLIGNFEYLPAGSTLVELFTQNSTQGYIAGYLGTLSAFFMIWFAGSLNRALGQQEGGDGRLSVIALGGGVASAVIAAVSFAATLSAFARASEGGGIDPETAVALGDLASTLLGNVFPIILAVMIEATAIVSFRTGMFPAWFAWLSTVLVLGMVSPFGYIVQALGLLWVLVISIWLYARGASEGSAEAAS